jgi:hypothetical protein
MISSSLPLLLLACQWVVVLAMVGFSPCRLLLLLPPLRSTHCCVPPGLLPAGCCW